MTLEGPFTTNRTKEYHSLTGSIKLERKNDFWQSALVPHLQELGMENKLSFVKEENDLIAFVEAKQDEAILKQLEQQYQDQFKKEQQLTKDAQRQSAAKQAADKRAMDEKEKAALALSKQEAALKEQSARETAKQFAAKEQQDKKLAEEKLKPGKALAKQEVDAKKVAEKQIAKQEFAKEQQARKQAEDKIKAENELTKQQALAKKLAEKELIKQQAEKDQLALKQQPGQYAAKEKELAKLATLPSVKKPLIAASPVNITPADNVSQRKTILHQTVTFSSDSLLLTLYDNGEVDGDTVSVLMNGQLIIAKQGLSTTASKKTIYIPSTTDRVELVMYAESLGSIPPNTGLLVIRDGKDLYEIRFSGDLQKNASIVFNRKKE
jgi:actin-related protein